MVGCQTTYFWSLFAVRCVVSVCPVPRKQLDYTAGTEPAVRRVLSVGTLASQCSLTESLLANAACCMVCWACSWDRYRPSIADRWKEKPEPGAGVFYDLGAHMFDQVWRQACCVLCLFALETDSRDHPPALVHCFARRALRTTLRLAPPVVLQVLTLFGQPQWVHCDLLMQRKDTLVTDGFEAQLGYASGTRVSLGCSSLAVAATWRCVESPELGAAPLR